MKHTITIRAADREGEYSVDYNGSPIVTDSARPIREAAESLRSNGADDHDLLLVTGACATFLPVSIFSILKPRSKALRSDIERQFRHCNSAPLWR